MPTNFLAQFYLYFRRAGKDNVARVYDFIRDNAVRISNCRELYMRMRMVNRQKSDEEVLEITRKNLLEIASIDRPKALKNGSLDEKYL